MGPHEQSAGERSEARTRTKQIRDFEYHWDGAFTGTRWEGGEFTTTYAADGQTVTGGDITDLRAAARHYYSSAQAPNIST